MVGEAFTVKSTVISLVLRAPMCKSNPRHIGTTLRIHSLRLAQKSTSAVVEVDGAFTLERTATSLWHLVRIGEQHDTRRRR